MKLIRNRVNTSLSASMWSSVGWARVCSAGPAAVGEVLEEASISCATFWINCLLSCILTCLLRCCQRVLARPMVLDMLEEFGVPGAVHLVALAPIKRELGHLSSGELQIDISQAQHVVNILAGLPVRWQPLRFSRVLQCGIIAQPLAFDVLDEFAVPDTGDVAALSPIEDELSDGVFDKRQANVRVFHQHLQRILARAPVAVNSHFLVAAKLIGFLGPPLAQQMFEKACPPGVMILAPLAPIGDEFRQVSAHKIVGNAVLRDMAHQLSIRLPVWSNEVGAAGRGSGGAGRTTRAARHRGLNALAEGDRKSTRLNSSHV